MRDSSKSRLLLSPSLGRALSCRPGRCFTREIRHTDDASPIMRPGEGVVILRGSLGETPIRIDIVFPTSRLERRGGEGEHSAADQARARHLINGPGKSL